MTTVSFYQLLYFTLSIVYIYKINILDIHIPSLLLRTRRSHPSVKSKKQQIEFTPDNEMGRISFGWKCQLTNLWFPILWHSGFVTILLFWNISIANDLAMTALAVVNIMYLINEIKKRPVEYCTRVLCDGIKFDSPWFTNH